MSNDDLDKKINDLAEALIENFLHPQPYWEFLTGEMEEDDCYERRWIIRSPVGHGCANETCMKCDGIVVEIDKADEEYDDDPPDHVRTDRQRSIYLRAIDEHHRTNTPTVLGIDTARELVNALSEAIALVDGRTHGTESS